jgi:hypothetical protein
MVIGLVWEVVHEAPESVEYSMLVIVEPFALPKV